MRDLFPSLFVLAKDKDATIADYYLRGSGAVVWTPIFIRDAFVDDISLPAFLNLLNGFSPIDSPDSVIWNLNSRGTYTLKSYYLRLFSYSPLASQTGSWWAVSLENYSEKFSSIEGVCFCVGSFLW